MACLYGYVHSLPPDHLVTIDTWRFHQQGLLELKQLKEDPLSFFGGLFQDQYQSGFSRFFSTTGSYWNDLKNTVMVKLMTIFDLFSLGNYYTNLIFFNYIVLFGTMGLYRVFQNQFPNAARFLLGIIAVSPSILFWGSGMHKEGLLYTAMALILFHAHRMIHGRMDRRGLIIVLLSFVVIFILRNYVIFAMAPAFIAWWWTVKKGGRPWVVFLLVNITTLILFFGIPKLIPRIDPPMTMHLRQRSFVALGGRTALPVNDLRPDLGGFLHNLPSAVSFTFLHPLPGEGGKFYIPFTIELLALYVMFILSILFPDRGKRGSAIVLYSVNFAVLLFLIIGYCVPNVGAIIRYRSIGMPFLFLALYLSIDWDRLRRTYQRNTN